MGIQKRLIINCDDFGQSGPMNQAIIHLLEEGKVSSATMMAVAPGFEEAAAWSVRKQASNIGLHLTLTSEFDALRWSSITGHPSLHDEGGYQYKTVKEFEQGVQTKAMLREIQAQYDRVKKTGITISHVDNHMGSLYGMETGRSHIPHMFWKASRWGLPARFFRNIHKDDPLLGSLSDIERPVALAAAVADTMGVPIPDYLLSHPFDIQAGETYESFKQSIIDKLYALPDGICETYIHPGMEDSWMLNHIPHWEKRVWEFRLLFDDDFRYVMRDAGVELVNYRDVQEKLGRPRIRSAFRLFKELVR